jgi:quinol monooxygenase YgiN
MKPEPEPVPRVCQRWMRLARMQRLDRLSAHVVQQPRRGLMTPRAAPPAATAAVAADPLLAALAPGTQRFIPDAHVHVASHCTVPKDKAEEFWALSQELVPHCRKEPYQVYQHCLRARPGFAVEDADCEFVWLEEWTQPSGFEYHASGTVYNTHFHTTAGADGKGVDAYTDERCKVYSGPQGLQVLPSEEYLKQTTSRKDHVFVVSHVHVHAHKVAEFLVKAATLLPHCRAEEGNVFENLYQETSCGPVVDGDPCAFVWMEEWESEAAFEAHLEAPHVQAFWDSAKEIYDQEEQIYTFYGPEW